jgi:hypothetical protein
MKTFLIALSLLIFAASAQAKQVDLICTGQEIVRSKTGTEKGEVTYEISFDDEAYKITSMTLGLVLGCYEQEWYKSSGCDCDVSDKEIKCDAYIVGKSDKSMSGKQSFALNRFSGRMIFSRTYDLKTNGNLYVTGEAMCEALSKRKF